MKRINFQTSLVQWAILLLTCTNSFASQVIPPYNTRTDWHPEYECIYDAQHALIEYHYYRYNEYGNIIFDDYFSDGDSYREPLHEYEKRYSYKYGASSNILEKREDIVYFKEDSDFSYNATFYYDEIGRLMKCEESHPYGINSKNTTPTTYITEYTYDEIVKDFVILKNLNQISAETTILLQSEKADITRNDDKNITSVYYYTLEKAIPYGDEPNYIVDHYIKITFGEDKKADMISYYGHNYYNGEIDRLAYVSNIVWTKFDGQITDWKNPFDADSYPKSIIGLENIPESFEKTYIHYNYWTGELLKSKYVYEIDNIKNDGSFDFSERIYEEDREHWIEFIVLDDFGSYKATIHPASPGGCASDEYFKWDEFGTMLEKGDYNFFRRPTYDSRTGLPKEYKTNDHNTVTYTVFDKPGCASVELPENDESFPSEIYSIDGKRMTDLNLTPSIYIKHTGNKSELILK